KRDDDLERAVVDELAACSGRPSWEVFEALDALCEHIRSFMAEPAPRRAGLAGRRAFAAAPSRRPKPGAEPKARPRPSWRSRRRGPGPLRGAEEERRRAEERKRLARSTDPKLRSPPCSSS